MLAGYINGDCWTKKSLKSILFGNILKEAGYRAMTAKNFFLDLNDIKDIGYEMSFRRVDNR